MKKIIFCFVLFFIVIIVGKAETFSQDIRLRDHTIRATNGNNIYDSFLSIITRSNKEAVYCLNPYELLNVGGIYNEYYYNDSLFNLSDDLISKINLIAYYGYGYQNHTDIKWYGVTQFLIWKELGIGDVYYTTDVGGEVVFKYRNEIREIQSLVSNYYAKPVFAGNYYEYDLNTQYTIVDSSGLINDFEIESELDVYIENSKLHINTSNKEGVFEVKFRKNSPIKKDYVLYNLSGAQSLIYPGRVKDLEFSIYVEVSNRSIEIHKQDSENVKRNYASLSGALYELYYNNVLIDKLVTNENGIAKKEYLPKGEYYIREASASPGYKLDANTYKVYLNKDNKNVIINSYEEVIKGNLNIEKYYGENEVYTYENGAKFEIYDINNNYIDTITTADGIANKKLDYGKYLVKQVSGLSGYKKVDDFYVSIEEEKNYKYFLYNKKEELKKQGPLKVNVPNTGKSRSNYKISIIFIIIGFIFLILGKKKITLLK